MFAQRRFADKVKMEGMSGTSSRNGYGILEAEVTEELK